MNKELTIYEREDIQYIPKRTYNQDVMNEALQNLNVTNMAMMQNMLMQSQQQNAMMLNMINNTGYIEEEEGDFFGSIFKYLIVILFFIWLFLGFTGKGWNPLISIPNFLQNAKSFIETPKEGEPTKSEVKVCVGNYPCVTDENKKPKTETPPPLVEKEKL